MNFSYVKDFVGNNNVIMIMGFDCVGVQQIGIDYSYLVIFGQNIYILIVIFINIQLVKDMVCGKLIFD